MTDFNLAWKQSDRYIEITLWVVYGLLTKHVDKVSHPPPLMSHIFKIVFLATWKQWIRFKEVLINKKYDTKNSKIIGTWDHRSLTCYQLIKFLQKQHLYVKQTLLACSDWSCFDALMVLASVWANKMWKTCNGDLADYLAVLSFLSKCQTTAALKSKQFLISSKYFVSLR